MHLVPLHNAPRFSDPQEPAVDIGVTSAPEKSVLKEHLANLDFHLVTHLGVGATEEEEGVSCGVLSCAFHFHLTAGSGPNIKTRRVAAAAAANSKATTPPPEEFWCYVVIILLNNVLNAY